MSLPPPTRLLDIRLLSGNAAAWQAKLDLVAQAEHSLDLAYFILEDDASTLVLLDELQAAARRGVQVRLLLDHLMVWPHAALLQQRAAEPGLHIHLFRPPAPEWLQALREAGIDTDGFLVGLSGPDPQQLLQSLACAQLFPAPWMQALRQIAQAPRERRLAHVLEVLARLQQLAATADPSPELLACLGRLHTIVSGLKDYLHRTHHKLLLADQRHFIIGGRNLADAYHCDDAADHLPFRDLDIQACDARARSEEHAAAFEALWAQAQDVREAGTPRQAERPRAAAAATRPTSSFDARTRVLPDMEGRVLNGLPGSADEAAITETYTLCIRRFAASGRRGSIDIVSAYLFLDDDAARSSPALQALRQSLLDAAAVDGITVNLRTNALASTDLRPVNAAFYQRMGALIAAGVHIFELQPGHGALHAKAAAIGNDCLLIGSYNMDPRSELYDTNNLLVLHDAGGQATRAFREVWTAPALWAPVTAEDAASLQAQTEQEARRFAPLSRLL